MEESGYRRRRNSSLGENGNVAGVYNQRARMVDDGGCT